MNRVRSFKSLILYCKIRWKTILATGIVCLLLAAMAAVLLPVVKNKTFNEAAYQTALAEYETAVAACDAKIEKDNYKISTNTYLFSQSVLLGIDTDNELICNLYIDVVLKEAEQASEELVLATQKAVGKQVAAAISAMDFDALKGQLSGAYGLKQGKYLQESVFAEVDESGLIRLWAKGNEMEDVQPLLQAVFNELKTQNAFVTSSSYPFELICVSEGYTRVVDAELFAEQVERRGYIDEAQADILLQEEAKAALIAPNRGGNTFAFSVKNLIVYAVAGAVLGLILGVFFVIIQSIAGDVVCENEDIDDNLTDIVKMGYLPAKEEKAKEALRYLKEAAAFFAAEGTVLLTSSSLRLDQDKMEWLAGELKENGTKVKVITHIDDPEFLKAASEAQIVVLVEKSGVSSLKGMEKGMQLCKNAGASKCAYILLGA